MSYGSNSKGVGILFKPGLDFKITDIDRDTYGLFIPLDIDANSQNFRLFMQHVMTRKHGDSLSQHSIVI